MRRKVTRTPINRRIPLPRLHVILPTRPNQAALEKYRSRRNAQTAPRLKVTVTDGQPHLNCEHPHPPVGAALFEQALGTADHDFASGLINQISKLAYSADGKASEEVLNFLLSVVRGVQPRDETEALLATQMAGVHTAIMKTLQYVEQAVSLRQREMAERMLNRLVRTTLKRCRSGSSKLEVSQNRNQPPPCGAKTRSGRPCRSLPVTRRTRCRMHGGAAGSGAPRGNKNALKSGLYTREAIEEHRQLRTLMREARLTMSKIK